VTEADENQERRKTAEDRDRAADARDVEADAKDAAETDKEVETDAVLAATDERDERADDRDFAANRRDMAANLKAFLDNVDDIDAFNARTSAAHETTLQDDRAASKKGPQLLSNTLLAPNEHDDAIGNRQSPETVET
jgi:hypothetical protein